MVEFTTVSKNEDLLQILDLQQVNLQKSLSEEEVSSQGFVTVNHSFEILKKMNHPFPHIIAKAESRVVGYVLVMLESMRNELPVLVPMFEKIDQISIAGKLLKEAQYFVMGQVCIDKKYRGQGLFDKLYEKMKLEMKNNFDFIITEVATRNLRSIRAHYRVGFKELLIYESGVEEWSIIGWKIN